VENVYIILQQILFRKRCTKFRHYRLSFIGDIIKKTFWSLFFLDTVYIPRRLLSALFSFNIYEAERQLCNVVCLIRAGSIAIRTHKFLHKIHAQSPMYTHTHSGKRRAYRRWNTAM